MLRTRDYWVAAMCSGHNRSCAVAPEDPARPRLPACKMKSVNKSVILRRLWMTQDVHCGHRRQSHHPVPPLPLQGAFLHWLPVQAVAAITDRLLIDC